MSRAPIGMGFLGALIVLATGTSASADFRYIQTNLVSDTPGLAAVTDPSLINPWGISESATSPFWVSNAGSNNSTLYNTVGAKQALTVAVAGGPTGQVFNATTDFKLANGSKANFIFATLGGTVLGWNAGGTAETKFAATNGASYTGLAIGNSGGNNFLYAADDANGRIDVLNASYGAHSLPVGAFIDPNLPTGFKPFNIQNLGGTLYVTYENGTFGGGVVDRFDTAGNFLGRVTANGPGGRLQSPWGVAIAPASFGSLGGALLVGNEDDGIINGFDPITGAYIGTVLDWNGNPLVNLGLWGLQFGNGGNGGRTDTLYFAAGLAGEVHGLFGSISVPEPGSVLLTGLGAAFIGVASVRRKRRLAA